MLRSLLLCAFVAGTLGVSLLPATPNPKRDDDEKRYSKCYPTKENVYGFEVETLTGERQNLTKYRGKVLLIVNVATFCDYTEQYKHFNGLLERNPGVELLAFPCNQFELQEPGHNDEILNGLKYVRPGKGWEPGEHVHIYGKLEVNGEKEHPMYAFLKNTCPPTSQKIGKREELFYDPIKTNDVVWNFEKFLIDKRGRPRFRFFPATWNGGKRVEEHFKTLLEEEV
uniref:Glutathione peroxidase n=1 Tax=Plectus sambesii TaxID=2011161 RepID=A0A914X891_9BILA